MEERPDSMQTFSGRGLGSVGDDEPDDRPAGGLNGVTSYEDGDAVVVCDRKNAQAWIRSDTVAGVDS